MVQSINTKALLTLASVVRRPSLLVPHVSVDHISQVDFAALRHCGVRAVIFDKDNTLTAPYALEVHPLVKDGLQQAREIFGNERVAILSNSAGTLDDPEYADAKAVEEALGISVIRHAEKKPGGLEEVLKHFGDQLEPSQLCMVGDRLLTDVVFGNLHGMLTIHTLPLSLEGDNPVAKMVRKAENKGLYGSWFGSRYLLAKNKPDHALWPGEAECPLKLMSTDDDTTSNKQ